MSCYSDGEGEVKREREKMVQRNSTQFLTIQNSKFHIETWIFAKTKVVKEGKIYNFDVGQHLIWALDLTENKD